MWDFSHMVQYGVHAVLNTAEHLRVKIECRQLRLELFVLGSERIALFAAFVQVGGYKAVRFHIAHGL